MGEKSSQNETAEPSSRDASSSNGFKGDQDDRYRESSHYSSNSSGNGYNKHPRYRKAPAYYIETEKIVYGKKANHDETSPSGVNHGKSTDSSHHGGEDYERHSPALSIGSEVYSDRELNAAAVKTAETASASHERGYDELDRGGLKSRVSYERSSAEKRAESPPSSRQSSARTSGGAHSRHHDDSFASTNGYHHHNSNSNNSREYSAQKTTWTNSALTADDNYYDPPFSAILAYYPRFLADVDLLKMFEKFGTIEKTTCLEKPDNDTGKILIKYAQSSAAIKAFEDTDGRIVDSNDFSHSSRDASEPESRLKVRLLNKKYENGSDEYFSRDHYQKARKLFVKIGVKLTIADLRHVFEKWGQLCKVQILYHQDRTSKGLAYITFQRGSESAKAKEEISASFCPKFAFVQTSEEAIPKFIAEKYNPKQRRFANRRDSSSTSSTKVPRKRSMSPQMRKEESGRDTKIRRLERTYSSSKSREQAPLKAKQSSEVSSKRTESLEAPSHSTSYSRTYSDESKKKPSSSDSRPTESNQPESAPLSESAKPQRDVDMRTEEAPAAAAAPKENHAKSFRSIVDQIANVTEKTGTTTEPAAAKSDDSASPKPVSSEKELEVQISKTSLKVRTKMDEKLVKSLADLVPGLVEVTAATTEDEKNVFVLKYGEEKMAEHAKDKLAQLDFGAHGGRLEVEYLKTVTIKISAPPRPVLKSSVSLVESQLVTLSSPREQRSPPPKPESKPDIPKNSLTKLKDFSLASILGLPSKIESPSAEETVTSPKPTPVEKTPQQPETAKTSPPVAKPVDPRLQRRDQAAAKQPSSSSLHDLLKASSSQPHRAANEPKKKITVISIECEKPTTKEAMKIVLNQFNNLIDVMMSSTDQTKAYAFFESEEDAVHVASMINNKRMADNHIKTAKTNAGPSARPAETKIDSATTSSPTSDSLKFLLFNHSSQVTYPGKSYESLSSFVENISRVPDPTFSYLAPQTSPRSINLKEYFARSNSLNM